ncbi:hypothetical protein ACSQ67_025959 [Phaseolus vulgaris]
MNFFTKLLALERGYRENIVDIREEIQRRARSSRVTPSLLKAWWRSHSKGPYPTEEDKARLV